MTFAHLATKAFSKGLRLFKYRPKFHMGTHLTMDIAGNMNDVALNPVSSPASMFAMDVKMQNSMYQLQYQFIKFFFWKAEAFLHGVMRISLAESPEQGGPAILWH